MSRVTIHFGAHNHPIMDGKCWEFVKEIKRLIIQEVDRTFNVNISTISFNVSKTFLASCLLDDYNDGLVKLFKGEHWSIQDVMTLALGLRPRMTHSQLLEGLECESK
jgi:hypothetical protein